MAKKKVKSLSPAEYWEWRCTLEEIKVAQMEQEKVRLEAECLAREVDLARLKLTLKQQKISQQKEEVEKLRKGYDDFREKLEKSLGTTLENKVIDPYTYEVKEIE